MSIGSQNKQFFTLILMVKLFLLIKKQTFDKQEKFEQNKRTKLTGFICWPTSIICWRTGLIRWRTGLIQVRQLMVL